MHGDGDLVGLEARDRERDAIAVLAGPQDVVRRVVVFRLKPEALVHQVGNAIEANARTPERSRFGFIATSST
jgi:hypothetical protein